MGMSTRRRGSAISWIVLVASLLSTGSLAQGYPDHLIRVVVPYGPGFAADTMARIISDRLSPILGQPIIIENRPGGGGVVGTDLVVKSKPDGYTLLGHTMASLGPSASTNAPYDPLTDLVGITPMARVSGILVASKARGFKTLQDLIAYGRQNPNVLNFASLGPGSPSHIYAEKLMQLAEFDAVPIAYKGPSEAMADLIAGRVDFFALTVGTALPFVREGNLTPLAITSSKRPPFLPDIPTTIEAGLPNSSLDSGVGVWAPKGTPRSIILDLNEKVTAIVQEPEVNARFASLGAEPWLLTPDEFDQHMRTEIQEVRALMTHAQSRAH
jgi:tripartite-type tricarboxylate transporter receptor subunit TctC